MPGPGDDLFMALAQAKAQPSRAFRALDTGVGAANDIAGGYLRGRQIRSQLAQPEAIARLINATPQGHDIEQQIGPDALREAFYGSNPKEALDYLGKSTELAQRGALGYAGINERESASRRAADVANQRTKSMETIFGGKNLSQNIALHENEIQRLTGEQSRLAAQVPGGLGGTIQALIGRGGDIGQYLQDPKVAAIAAQMKHNQDQIQFHQAAVMPMYKAQGIVPPGVLDNSDLNNINPPPMAGGDNSIVTGLPGFGQ